MSKLKKI
jgi:ATP-dependent RNA helicase DDX54/DBP10